MEHCWPDITLLVFPMPIHVTPLTRYYSTGFPVPIHGTLLTRHYSTGFSRADSWNTADQTLLYWFSPCRYMEHRWPDIILLVFLVPIHGTLLTRHYSAGFPRADTWNTVDKTLFCWFSPCRYMEHLWPDITLLVFPVLIHGTLLHRHCSAGFPIKLDDTF
jgi:hypothetical protein